MLLLTVAGVLVASTVAAIVGEMLWGSADGRMLHLEKFVGRLQSIGYTRTELAESPLLRRVVERELQYDFAWQGARKLDGLDAEVLVLGWEPGKISYRWALRHTPDICWPNAGFVEVSSKSLEPNGHEGLAACYREQRVFASEGGRKIGVMFLHLLSGESVRIGNGMPLPLWTQGTEFYRLWFRQRGGQVFVRVTVSGDALGVGLDGRVEQAAAEIVGLLLAGQLGD